MYFLNINIYKIVIWVHVSTSVMFLLLAIYLFFRSFHACFSNREYTVADKKLEFVYICLLYLGLALGSIMYFFLHPKSTEIHSISDAIKFSTLRFWAVEHLSIMLFALIMAQIGRVFTNTKIPSKEKFVYSTFYFGIATLTAIISTGIYLVNKP